jgi:hypothetical protein
MMDYATMSDLALFRAALADPPRVRRIGHDPDGGMWVTWDMGEAAYAAMERLREPGESVEEVMARCVRDHARHLDGRMAVHGIVAPH